MAISGRKMDPVRLTMRRAVMLFLLALIIFGAFGVWSAYRKERESAALRMQSQSALADLTEQHDKLVANIADLESDRGKEAALRQEYSVGKEGEHLIVIVDPATTTPIQATSTFLQKIESAFWW